MRMFCLAACLMFSLFMSRTAVSGGQAEPEVRPPEVPVEKTLSKPIEISGVVRKIDLAEKTMVVQTKKGEMVFHFAVALIFKFPSIGDEVTIAYQQTDGKTVATQIIPSYLGPLPLSEGGSGQMPPEVRPEEVPPKGILK